MNIINRGLLILVAAAGLVAGQCGLPSVAAAETFQELVRAAQAADAAQAAGALGIILGGEAVKDLNGDNGFGQNGEIVKLWNGARDTFNDSDVGRSDLNPSNWSW